MHKIIILMRRLYCPAHRYSLLRYPCNRIPIVDDRSRGESPQRLDNSIYINNNGNFTNNRQTEKRIISSSINLQNTLISHWCTWKRCWSKWRQDWACFHRCTFRWGTSHRKESTDRQGYCSRDIAIAWVVIMTRLLKINPILKLKW